MYEYLGTQIFVYALHERYESKCFVLFKCLFLDDTFMVVIAL